MKVEF